MQEFRKSSWQSLALQAFLFVGLAGLLLHRALQTHMAGSLAYLKPTSVRKQGRLLVHKFECGMFIRIPWKLPFLLKNASENLG